MGTGIESLSNVQAAPFMTRTVGALCNLLAGFDPGGDRWTLMRLPDALARRRSTSSRIFQLRVAPEGRERGDFRPGQFAFVSFPGRGILASPRALAIASAPSEGRFLDFQLKDEDGWTFAAKRLEAEPDGGRISARVILPFGRFSYPASPGAGRFVFLAAGMGVVPFLSMLRFMADADAERKVLLIWGGRTHEDMPGKAELEEARERLRGFGFVPALTHDPLWTGERGRIDGEKLRRIVPGFFGSRFPDFEWNTASYWICGPGTFEKDLASVLRSFGARKAAIHSSAFSL